MPHMKTAAADALRLARIRERAASGEARTIRERHRLSTTDVARAAGTTHTTIVRWELGKRRPTGPAALRWGELLDALEKKAAS